MRFPLLAIIFVFFASSSLLTGCSISYSLGKSSDSISASLDSISDSSDSSDNDASDETANMYIEDVAVATVHFVSNMKNSELFQQTISNIAWNHGIVDWEQEDITYVAMGQGLRQAGVDEHAIPDFPYFRIVAGGVFYTQILAGYHQPS